VGDGPQRESLQKKAGELGVSDRVKFLGEVGDAELAALYSACDVFVLPSITRQEAFGVVLLEAMAFGKPMVTTKLGTGADWVNQDGETGIVVPPGDASALSAAIGSLLRDRSRRALMGSAALRRVQSLFSPGRMTTSVLELYRQLMGRDDRQAVA
jgi:rhamnosyl/mannosyltransferase